MLCKQWEKKKIREWTFFVFYSFNFENQLPFKIKQKILLGKILKYKIVTYYVNYFKILSKKQYFNKIVNIINIILIEQREDRYILCKQTGGIISTFYVN